MGGDSAEAAGVEGCARRARNARRGGALIRASATERVSSRVALPEVAEGAGEAIGLGELP